MASASSSSDALEAARYGTLPPTVFAPGGRLHGVERVARESYPPGDDELSCVVIALHCGGGDKRTDVHDGVTVDGNNDNGEEFAIMSGIGAISPFLHKDESFIGHEGQTDTGKGYIPLVLDNEDAGDPDLPPTPIAILSPTLVAGVGGKGIDSAVLLRRSIEVALSNYRSDNGGIEWFMAHSLEGTNGDDSVGPRLVGGASGVQVASLARRMADIAQDSTQSLGGKYGRMLSVSG